MKMLTSVEIRNIWLNFFKERGHMIEPGAPLVPNNDPTLLWINAGVAPLKKYFDGSMVPENPRITNAQKARGADFESGSFFENLSNLATPVFSNVPK